MLPTANRLKKKRDFENVFKNGKGYKEDFLYFKAAKNNLKTSRFGFVVGKKISNKAIVRNRIKRKIREIIRINLPCVKNGTDAVVIVLPSFKTDNFGELEKITRKLLERAKMIKL